MKNLTSKIQLTIFLAAALALVPAAVAVDPPPDGGYPHENTAEGEDALFSLNPDTDDGHANTAAGYHALFSNTSGFNNTAVGASALDGNVFGTFNTAIGWEALASNSGSLNTAVGSSCLASNTTGNDNTALGGSALISNLDGYFNVALGEAALGANTSGAYNIGDGSGTLGQNPDGNLNIALGAGAGANLRRGSRNVYIANPGNIEESKTIHIGAKINQTATFIAGISGVTVADGVGVVIDTNGQLGTLTSSARYKEAIKPMDKSSEALLNLKPVTFRYKKNLDPKAIPQFGLVAEDVAKVDPELVARDEEGRPYTVRYDAVNAMLLNEFLKEHRKVEQLEGTVAQQQKQIQALTVGIQKISVQLETSESQQAIADNQSRNTAVGFKCAPQ